LIPVAARDFARTEGFDVAVYDVGEPLLIPIAVAVVSRHADGCAAVGTAGARNLAQATERALNEAFVLHDSARKSLGHLSPRPESSLGRVRWAYRNGIAVRTWYQARSRPPDKDRYSNPEIGLSDLIEQVGSSLNSPVIAVDVSDHRARSSGWTVWRVLVPALNESPAPFG
jgi:ribosomal protein S12 methylthiotransferase accessory factor YcaO